MKIFRIVLLLASVAMFTRFAAADTAAAVNAINALGLDLYRTQPSGGNLLLSPYSIQSALAMAYAGADGDTRAEMQRVLHYPADERALDSGFAELAREFSQVEQDSAQAVAGPKTEGLNPTTPVEIRAANRLFVQQGYPFRAPFLALMKDSYGAPLDELDFAHASEAARATINGWVEEQTKGKIQDLIPPSGVTRATRLVLANAIYLHAGWARPFEPASTEPVPFFVHGTDSAMVPTMSQVSSCGYVHRDGYTAVSLRYVGGGLQFLILLPDDRDGLPALERKVTPELLADCANLPAAEIALHLPKFKLAPPTLALDSQLKQLGLKTAFDEPHGSANFDRMAPRKPDDYLYIGAVFHKTFIALDEQGTEAAAATAVVMMRALAVFANKPKPVEVQVDHPFLFAIQHVSSGACLFLGRVTDPRE